jgi:hypothetical protein
MPSCGTERAYKGGCRCADCRAANARHMARWRSRHREHATAYKRAWDQKLRKEVIDHYGGKCSCCGETQLELLSLDHTNGGGCKHRRETKRHGTGMWAWAKRENYPPLFQVLCHNCNQAKGFYGQCPHQRMVQV